MTDKKDRKNGLKTKIVLNTENDKKSMKQLNGYLKSKQ